MTAQVSAPPSPNARSRSCSTRATQPLSHSQRGHKRQRSTSPQTAARWSKLSPSSCHRHADLERCWSRIHRKSSTYGTAHRHPSFFFQKTICPCSAVGALVRSSSARWPAPRSSRGAVFRFALTDPITIRHLNRLNPPQLFQKQRYRAGAREWQSHGNACADHFAAHVRSGEWIAAITGMARGAGPSIHKSRARRSRLIS